MTRYAIYFVPPPATPLATFGARSIGYDVSAGQTVPLHDHDIFRHPSAAAWTESPARYGFHATLKAPFELAEGESEAFLVEAADHLAGRLQPVALGPLAVTELGAFLALTPTGDTTAVDQLAASCVRTLEPFRAPLTPADRERRLSAPLTGRQIDYLTRWGYPYVFEEFRFHMTLTGPIRDAGLRSSVAHALEELHAPLASPQVVDALTVCRQTDRAARFTVLSRHPLLASG